VSEPLLRAANVAIRFGGLTALTGFNLEIHKGDLQGLIGPNGAGKTTAFNVLTGVYLPTEGDVFAGSTKLNGRRPHQINRFGLARTFQNIRLFKQSTVLDNVRVGIRAKSGWVASLLQTPKFRAEEDAIEKRARELLEVMGLSNRVDELAKNLPYGEQRRLEIARALGTQPKVLLLDEPAAGMNTREKADLMVLIRELRQRFELGILVIEHDMKLVMGICEKLTVLDHGETIASGEPASVRANDKVIEAYLGEAPAHG
jgi:branched-chain amino acid transport system ATP-binding protein